MHLVVAHYHFRPGGVRRVIEMALPQLLAKRRPRISRVVLLGGETPPGEWLERLRQSLSPVELLVEVHPALGYLAEQRGRSGAEISAQARHFLKHSLPQRGSSCLVWAHNPGLGRNPLFIRELALLCEQRGFRLMLHQHDWWFDNRWRRWPEMRKAGLKTLASVAQSVFPAFSCCRHATINRTDHGLLKDHAGISAGWIPNPTTRPESHEEIDARAAADWFKRTLGHEGPIWLVPCRLMRRKNLAEALLLMRWLRPPAILVTTAAVSSDDERPYAQRLEQAACRHGWPLHLSVLARKGTGAPPVQAAIAASEALVLSSLQEGFGLPLLEAAAHRKPLIARRLGNVMPDLDRLGFSFPQVYEELWIDTALFDAEAEEQRQKRLFARFRDQLPSLYRRTACLPDWPTTQGGRKLMPFSRLSLSAQIEVLAQPPEYSWALCAPFNPLLRQWRALAARGGLKVPPWRSSVAGKLSCQAYAARFFALARKGPRRELTPDQASRIQHAFILDRLDRANQYPLLWTDVS